MCDNALVPSFAYDDLRAWLREAERIGELAIVKNASWEKDIGQASEIVNHSETAPCVLFEDIPGSAKNAVAAVISAPKNLVEKAKEARE